MYKIVVDVHHNKDNYKLHKISTSTNERVLSLNNLTFKEVIDYILKLNKDKKLNKLVTVYFNSECKPYNKKEITIN